MVKEVCMQCGGRVSKNRCIRCGSKFSWNPEKELPSPKKMSNSELALMWKVSKDQHDHASAAVYLKELKKRNKLRKVS